MFPVIFLLLLTFAACSNRNHHQSFMPFIDSLKQCVNNDPAKALQMLKDSSTLLVQFSENERRHSQLYMLLANVKLYKYPKNDSLSQIILRYFSNSSNPELKSMAYYVSAQVHDEIGATETALKEFYIAKDVPGLKKYPDQASRVCSGLSSFYVKKGAYDLALSLRKEGIKYVEQAKDSIYLSAAYEDVANTYTFVDKSDSASMYYLKAIDNASKYKDSYRVNCCRVDYTCFLLMQDSISKSKQILSLTTIPEKEDDLGAYYANKIRFYYRVANFDSCCYYIDLVRKLSEPYGRLMALGYKYKCGLKLEKKADALSALESYTNLKDSLFSVSKVEEIRKVRSKYDYLLAQKEKEAMSKRARFISLSISSVAILIILGFYIFIQRQKLKNKQRVDELQAASKLRLLQYEKGEESLRDKQDEVEELRYQLEQSTTKESSFQVELATLRKQLAEVAVDYKTVQLASHKMEEQSFRQSPIFMRLLTVINQEAYADFRPVDWEQLQEACEKSFRSFFDTLAEFSLELNDNEIKVCYLTKINVSSKDISRLLFKAPSTISTSKARIYTKLMKKKGKAADFDELIDSM